MWTEYYVATSVTCLPAFLDKVTAVGGVGPGNNGSDRYQMSPDTLSGTTLCNSTEANTLSTDSADICAGQSTLLVRLLSTGSSYPASPVVNCWDYLTFNLHPILLATFRLKSQSKCERIHQHSANIFLTLNFLGRFYTLISLSSSCGVKSKCLAHGCILH